MARSAVLLWLVGLVMVFNRVESRSVPVVGNVAARQAPPLVQLVQVPRGCLDACTPIVNIIDLCATFTCLCTAQNEAMYRGCVDCIVARKPNATVIEQGQDAVNGFATTCNQNNQTIVTQTVSGFTGQVGSPSASGTSLASLPPPLSSSAPLFPTSSLRNATSITGLMTPLPTGSGSVTVSMTSGVSSAATPTSPVSGSGSDTAAGASPSPTDSGASGLKGGFGFAGASVVLGMVLLF
ncbi:hypothetical protein VKT23_020140 [Stygiomarasmius scandens]|uniref:Extracellular membrane protein CFEM domain-containing protein n=1 Tax=Marasmiellus scandens TaxID=2682957 RepID=A0ABR1IJM3_9AGAR